MSYNEVRTHLRKRERERERDAQVMSGEIIKNRNIHLMLKYFQYFLLITVQEEVNSFRLHTRYEPACGGREHTRK